MTCGVLFLLLLMVPSTSLGSKGFPGIARWRESRTRMPCSMIAKGFGGDTETNAFNWQQSNDLR